MSSEEEIDLPLPLSTVPVDDEVVLLSYERAMFDRFLVAKPGDGSYEERESARIRGRLKFVCLVQELVPEVTGEPAEVPKGKAERLIDYLCSDGILGSCLNLIDERRAFGKKLDLRAAGLKACDVLSILFGMNRVRITNQLNLHVAKWVTETVRYFATLVETDIRTEAAAARMLEPRYKVEDMVGIWLLTASNGSLRASRRYALEEYLWEHGGLGIEYTGRKKGQNWVCTLSVYGKDVGCIDVEGEAATPGESEERAAAEMLRQLAKMVPYEVERVPQLRPA
ncbi:hypothetical protein TWF718_006581 [Orbilia javanica]|uniref:Uncharacterized protein n=1 Tax=Orbilia javanica TaxID=47235 RepID=A0AAN8RN03_9PEZI